MIVRMWTASIAPERIPEYERFAAAESLPMFKSQRGNLGVLFTRSESTCVVVSLWDSSDAVEALSRSATYQRTVRRIGATGFLTGPTSTTVWETHGGWVSARLLLAVERERVRIDATMNAARRGSH
jgi:heme-degrading monooxygenase HmoA